MRLKSLRKNLVNLLRRIQFLLFSYGRCYVFTASGNSEKIVKKVKKKAIKRVSDLQVVKNERVENEKSTIA